MLVCRGGAWVSVSRCVCERVSVCVRVRFWYWQPNSGRAWSQNCHGASQVVGHAASIG